MSPLFSLRHRARRPVGIAFSGDHLLVRASDGRWTRSRLPAGFVTASPTAPNLASSAEAARVVQAAVAALGPGGGRSRDTVIALPDRAAHAAFSERSGSGAARKLRAELVRGLAAGSGAGSPGLDARFRFGTLSSGRLKHRSTLGAVSGATVVQQYEMAAEAAGLRVRWVDGASLAVLPEWLAAAGGASGKRILLLLHPRHFVLAAASGRRLTGFRMKLRAVLDPEPPLLAVRRLGETGALRVAVWGDGADAAAEALRSAGLPADEVFATEAGEGRPAVSPVTDRALAALLRRIGARVTELAPVPVAVRPKAA